MNRCFVLVLIGLVLPLSSQAMSTSYFEEVTFSNSSKSFKQNDFESLIEKIQKEPKIYLQDFRDYSLPESKLVAQIFCDSLRATTKPEEIAKVDEQRLHSSLYPYDGQKFFRRLLGIEVLTPAEYTAKTPQYMSVLRVPSYVNQQCALTLTWSKKDPTIRVEWRHWHVGLGDTENHPFNQTRVAMNEFITRTLTELTKKPVILHSSKDNAQAVVKP